MKRLESISGEPFKHVSDDLERTKEFAINNILKTDFKDIEEASHYNLMLKGKNFRSAIMFTLARAMFANHRHSKGTDFQMTRQYTQVMTLAAAIEIAHNASLLQDDIIDRADSRRS